MAINREPQVFLFLSKILGRNIIGATGEALGRVYDLTAEFVEPYPIVTGIIFSSAQKKTCFFTVGGCYRYGSNHIRIRKIYDRIVLP
jgi:sporulation protein YlmC with PRC-barrel domain